MNHTSQQNSLHHRQTTVKRAKFLLEILDGSKDHNVIETYGLSPKLWQEISSDVIKSKQNLDLYVEISVHEMRVLKATATSTTLDAFTFIFPENVFKFIKYGKMFTEIQ